MTDGSAFQQRRRAVEAACWVHARRPFFQMADLAATARRRAQGKTLAVISPLALEAVRRIHALFEIERSVNGQSAERRRAVRQELSAPLASASQACGSTSFNLAVKIKLYITAARWPPRSEPANNHDFLPRAIPRSARLPWRESCRARALPAARAASFPDRRPGSPCLSIGGWLSLLNRLWMFFGFPSIQFFSALPRTKPIEIDSRVPILSPRLDQPKAHSNPTARQPHNQISSAPSNTEPFESSSPAFTFWAARSSINSRCASNIRFIAGSERSLD